MTSLPRSTCTASGSKWTLALLPQPSPFVWTQIEEIEGFIKEQDEAGPGLFG